MKNATPALYSLTRMGGRRGACGSGSHMQKILTMSEPLRLGRFSVALNRTMLRTTVHHIWSGTSQSLPRYLAYSTIIQIMMPSIAGVSKQTMRLKHWIHLRKFVVRNSSSCLLTAMASACALLMPPVSLTLSRGGALWWAAFSKGGGSWLCGAGALLLSLREPPRSFPPAVLEDRCASASGPSATISESSEATGEFRPFS
mmetsp:Transcript_137866/g.428413  ORF Transcript_137866/g.428413 Transcript_137866/m.428413 type:complete len:200 (+) Transcript_137866:550-1149(+)